MSSVNLLVIRLTVRLTAHITLTLNTFCQNYQRQRGISMIDEDISSILTRRLLSLQWRTPYEPCASMAGSGNRWTHPGDMIKNIYNITLYILAAWTFPHLKDVRVHCYCASLVRTLYMTWRVPRHVFQARAQSRNSTKYRADGLCGNLICQYFCWMLGDPHFFLAVHFLLWFFPLY